MGGKTLKWNARHSSNSMANACCVTRIGDLVATALIRKKAIGTLAHSAAPTRCRYYKSERSILLLWIDGEIQTVTGNL